MYGVWLYRQIEGAGRDGAHIRLLHFYVYVGDRENLITMNLIKIDIGKSIDLSIQIAVIGYLFKLYDADKLVVWVSVCGKQNNWTACEIVRANVMVEFSNRWKNQMFFF